MRKIVLFLCSFALFSLCLFPHTISAYEGGEEGKEGGEPMDAHVLTNPWDIQHGDQIVTLHRLQNQNQTLFALSFYQVAEGRAQLQDKGLVDDWQERLRMLLQVYQQNSQDELMYQSIQLLLWEKSETNFTFVKSEDQCTYEKYKQSIEEKIASLLFMPDIKTNLTLQVDTSVPFANDNFDSQGVSVTKEDPAIVVDVASNTLSTTSNKMRTGFLQFQKTLASDAAILYKDNGYHYFTITPSILKRELSYGVQAYGKIQIEALEEQPQNALVSDNGVEMQYGYESFATDAYVYASEDIYDVWNQLVYRKGDLVKILNQENKDTLFPAGTYDVQVVGVDEQDVKTITIDKDSDLLTTHMVHAYKHYPLFQITIAKDWELHDEIVPYTKVALYNAETIYDGNGNLIVPANTPLAYYVLDKESPFSMPMKLVKGSYYIQEVETSPIYEKDEQRYDFNLNDGLFQNIKLSKGELKKHTLRVFANQKGRGVEASFTLYDNKQEEIATYTTDKSGKIAIENLVEDTYYVKQTSLPKEYQLQNTLAQVDLTQDTTYDMSVKKGDSQKVSESEVIHTNDNANHKPLEVSMLASLVTMYYLGFKKLRKL